MAQVSVALWHSGSDEFDASEGNVTADRPRVVLLAAPESSPSVLYGLYDVLLSRRAMSPDMTTGQTGEALLDVVIVAATREPFRCFGNVLVEPGADAGEVGSADVICC